MYDIFISYRRDGGHEMARLLYEHFRLKGLHCFFDLEELGAGEFNVKLLDSIDASKNFVLILSPNALERCRNEGDWVRCEIEHAMKKGKNIVPLMLSGFSWPEDLPKSLAKLPFYNGVSLVREYFDASLAKLIDLLVLDRTAKVKATKAGAAAPTKAGVDSWLERAYIFLEDGEWKKADTYAEKVLDVDPKNGEAYLVKLMAALCVAKRENLKRLKEPFDANPIYKTLMRYADDTLKNEVVGYIEHIRDAEAKRIEATYQKAVKDLARTQSEDECKVIAATFASLGAYKDSAEKVKECRVRAEEIVNETKYLAATALEKQGTVDSLLQAAEAFAAIGKYKDSVKKVKACRDLARETEQAEKYAVAEAEAGRETVASLKKAAKAFASIGKYKDAAEKAQACRDRAHEIEQAEKYAKAEAEAGRETVASLKKAAEMFASLDTYRDSAKRAQECRARTRELECEALYNEAAAFEARGTIDSLKQAAKLYGSVYEYKDCVSRVEACRARTRELECEALYNEAAAFEARGTIDSLKQAAKLYGSVYEYKDCVSRAEACRARAKEIENEGKYAEAEALLEKETVVSFLDAAKAFEALGGYRDSLERAEACRAWVAKKRKKKKALISLTAIALVFVSALLTCFFIDRAKKPQYTKLSDGTYALTDVGALFDVEEFEIPATYKGNPVTSIGHHAFRYCENLTSVTIPDSVTSIGDEAFHGCTGLTSVTIPDSVESIGKYAFDGCTGLTSITLPFVGARADGTSNGYFGYLFGEPLYAQRGAYVPESLKTVVITGETSIGGGAFSGCTGLTSVTIGDGVTSIGGSAFDGCTGLTSVTIGDGVTSIGEHAFSGCSGLTSITLPEGVESIGDGAFQNCVGLASITIPDGVTHIGKSAFSGCESLISVTIPDSVTSIGIFAFSGCDRLTSITLPDSVESIGDSAFAWCKSLSAVSYQGTVAQWKAIAKDDSWKSSTGGFTVTCIDGTVKE